MARYHWRKCIGRAVSIFYCKKIEAFLRTLVMSTSHVIILLLSRVNMNLPKEEFLVGHTYCMRLFLAERN